MNTASAPAKAIILGEHTALYKNPVLVAALDIRSRVSVTSRFDGEVVVDAPGLGLEGAPIKRHRRGMELVKKAAEIAADGRGFGVKITSEIPIASGLGSSASISAALIAALRAEAGKPWDLAAIAEGAWKCENLVHSMSSGVDPYAVAYGGVSVFKAGSIERLKVRGYPRLVIAHCGVPKDTWEIVEQVDFIKKSQKEHFQDFLEGSARLVREGTMAVGKSNWHKLGKLMDENHAMLSGIGVSSPALDTLVEAARGAGAFGAKLSGAGKGGIMVALADRQTEAPVAKALRKAGGKLIQSEISYDGVRLEP